MATITVNGRDIQIGDHERLNLIQAADRAGVEVPHYCWHPALSVVASCRMCLVEVGDKKPDGTVAMQSKVVPACQTPAKHGTVVVTDSKKVKDAQAGTLEYLLLNHPLDCPVCDQAGECFLQDYSYRFGRGYSRVKEEKRLKPDKGHIGDQIALFTDRCVMCSRCVRFTREISGTSELLINHRGNHAEIDIFPGMPCNNKLAGNVVDICPVGALCSKDFLYKQRVWFLQSKASVCPDCSTGCSITIDQNKDIVYRLRPRTNPRAQGHFMCDEGRFGYKYINSLERLTRPSIRRDGRVHTVAWEELMPALRGQLAEAAGRDGARMAVVLSPWLTCEEAYLAARYFKGLSPHVRLALGPVPWIGQDDSYPKGLHGEPPAPERTKFTIRAEKCPNRKGVEAILVHYQKEITPFSEVLRSAGAGELRTLVILAGSPRSWITPEEAAALVAVDLLVVVDILPSPAGDQAHYMLPGSSFAEKSGTFVNHAGLAQAIHAAIRPPGDARPEGRLLMELAERRGLFHAPSLREELTAAIPAFARLTPELGELGVKLEA